MFLWRITAATSLLQLLLPLAFLYQLFFFDSAYMPLVWLKAYISPIHKKGDWYKACNYNVQCAMCKIMEVIVKDHVMKYLFSKGLISNKQQAFIARYSTVTNLLECTHDWAISLHNSKVWYIQN